MGCLVAELTSFMSCRAKHKSVTLAREFCSQQEDETVQEDVGCAPLLLQVACQGPGGGGSAKQPEVGQEASPSPVWSNGPVAPRPQDAGRHSTDGPGSVATTVLSADLSKARPPHQPRLLPAQTLQVIREEPASPWDCRQ